MDGRPPPSICGGVTWRSPRVTQQMLCINHSVTMKHTTSHGTPKAQIRSKSKGCANIKITCGIKGFIHTISCMKKDVAQYEQFGGRFQIRGDRVKRCRLDIWGGGYSFTNAFALLLTCQISRFAAQYHDKRYASTLCLTYIESNLDYNLSWPNR